MRLLGYLGFGVHAKNDVWKYVWLATSPPSPGENVEIHGSKAGRSEAVEKLMHHTGPH